MQREVPTTVAIVVILLVLLVVGILFVRAWTGRRQLGQEALQPPPEVTREFQQRMGQGAQKVQPGSAPPGGYIPPPSGR